jgi:hypothetical protein
MAGSAAMFAVSEPPAIGHARSCGVCEMVGASDHSDLAAVHQHQTDAEQDR